MGIQSQGPLQDLGVFFRSASRLFFSGSEALLTRCPYEADGKKLNFGRGLIRTQEQTVRKASDPEKQTGGAPEKEKRPYDLERPL